MQQSTARWHDESGAVAVVVALTLTVLLLFSAFVIDLGALRVDRAASQSVSDMAAAAAAQVYEPGAAGSSREACEQALAYAEQNLATALAADGPGCAAFDAPNDVCDPSRPISAVFLSGDIRVEIHNPVADGDPLLGGEAYGPDIDGEPCDRFGVRVTRERIYLLAGAGGANSSGAAGASAVSTVIGGRSEGEFASLIVLQRVGCETLRTGGNPAVMVNRLITASGQEFPGTISVDTQPACGNNQNETVIRSQGSAVIQADGQIRSFGLASSDPGNSKVFNPTAVGTSDATPGRLWPEPVPGPIITRSPIDHRFNCRATYPTDGPIWSPEWSGLAAAAKQPIDGCEEGLSAFLSDLHGWLAVGSGVPAGGGWYDVVADGVNICNKNAGPISISGRDRVFINCPGDFEPEEVTITGADYVVINGDLSMGNQERLSIGDAVGGGTAVVMRNGDFDRTGGDLRLRNTFLYQVSGRLNIRGTSGDILWQGPQKRDGEGGAFPDNPEACRVDGRPTAACFGPLAYWGNGAGQNFIRGEASGGIIGTLFMPNALVELRGGQSVSMDPCTGGVGWSTIQGNSGSLNLEGAQFFANRYDLGGSSGLRLCPSPGTTVETSSDRTVALVR